jgi:hypothetical protein
VQALLCNHYTADFSICQVLDCQLETAPVDDALGSVMLRVIHGERALHDNFENQPGTLIIKDISHEANVGEIVALILPQPSDTPLHNLAGYL